jgi:integrase
MVQDRRRRPDPSFPSRRRKGRAAVDIRRRRHALRGQSKTAALLLPIVDELGDALVKDITPKMVRDLGPKLYPSDGTKTWTRHVTTPVRSVINNAHDLGKCAPIRIKGYSAVESLEQDQKRGNTGRAKYEPGSWEWLLQFRQQATPRCAALALTMFVTGARIGQAIAMHPGDDLDLPNCRIRVPGAKGHAARWLSTSHPSSSPILPTCPCFIRGDGSASLRTCASSAMPADGDR